jgi:hypothetical protein
MSGIQSTDYVQNLMYFIICLAVLGIILALVLYCAGIVPVQPAAPLVPLNSEALVPAAPMAPAL